MSLVKIPDAGGDLITYIRVDGLNYPKFPGNADQAQLVRSSRLLKGRKDDILLCSFSKSGSHWLHELLYMLLHGSASPVEIQKPYTMIEAQPLEKLDGLPSPRVLNTHYTFDQLPADIKSQKCKIVLIHRNPKDVVVSLYHHTFGMKGVYNYDGKWENFLPHFMKGNVEYGSWFTYFFDWQKAIEDHPDYPIHQMFYEDLQQNRLEEIGRLAKFLGIEGQENLYEQISSACLFDNMAERKRQTTTKQWKAMWKEEKPLFFRKGIVGDWKNTFTVAQNEMFDRAFAEELKKIGSKIKFEI